jgi:hypothetical protein
MKLTTEKDVDKYMDYLYQYDAIRKSKRYIPSQEQETADANDEVRLLMLGIDQHSSLT